MKDAVLKIYCDGGARGNPGPAAAAFVAVSPQGKVIEKKAKYIGRATNNFAEYMAVLLAFQWLKKTGKKNDVKHSEVSSIYDKKHSEVSSIYDIRVFLDSQLVANQMSGRFKIRQPKLRNIAARIKDLEAKVPGKVVYQAVPRNKNRLADFLVNKALNEKTLT